MCIQSIRGEIQSDMYVRHTPLGFIEYNNLPDN